MGLKTTNYFVESMGVYLPQAYAVVKNITISGDKGLAMIAIHESRELAVDPKIKPYHIEYVKFIVDRNVNDRITAYEAATKPYIISGYNSKTGTVDEITQYPFFYNWENDIIEEE